MTFAFEAPKKASPERESRRKTQAIFGIKSICPPINLHTVQIAGTKHAAKKNVLLHIFHLSIKKEIHSGENRQEKLASAVGSIIKRPFIIQVIIKIVCVYSLFSAAFLLARSNERKSRKCRLDRRALITTQFQARCLPLNCLICRVILLLRNQLMFVLH